MSENINLRPISELPEVESVSEGDKLLLNSNGEAKLIGASKVGGNNKQIVGTKDGNNITFTKTAAEIYALQEDIANYEIVLFEGQRKYTTTNFAFLDTATYIYFTCVLGVRVHYCELVFHKNNTITVYQSGTRELIEIPLPDYGDDSKYLVSRNGEYKLIDLEGKLNPMLQAILNSGSLVTVKTVDLFALINSAMQNDNISVQLAVVELDSLGNYKNVSVYNLVSLYDCNTESAYAILSNGVDKNIKMDAEGNFSYIE